ncbi:MAG TPA: UvrB/UvrC motif-containing protein [Gemmatimonadales bacterium]|nr:UvrB/UvrC motif-containing protein [Gemmatimonadales bacterium]
MKQRCDECHERDAVVSLTQVSDEQKTTVHLCERCAAARGVETSASLSNLPVGNFIAALGKGADVAAALPGPTPGGTCRACGASLDDFRETGRLGCAECYRNFEAPLRDLLRRLHGSTRHVGEQYVAGGQPRPGGPSGAVLREQLRQAIEAERFELAAQIRDQLKASEEQGA